MMAFTCSSSEVTRSTYRILVLKSLGKSRRQWEEITAVDLR
jgi:hypothetical protein